MNCKGDSFYRILKACGFNDIAKKYLDNQKAIEELMKRRRANVFKPMTPDLKSVSKN